MVIFTQSKSLTVQQEDSRSHFGDTGELVVGNTRHWFSIVSDGRSESARAVRMPSTRSLPGQGHGWAGRGHVAGKGHSGKIGGVNVKSSWIANFNLFRSICAKTKVSGWTILIAEADCPLVWLTLIA